MRTAGANPTDIEVRDIINKIDNESGYLDFPVRTIKDFLSNILLLLGVLLPDDPAGEGGRGALSEGDVQSVQQG